MPNLWELEEEVRRRLRNGVDFGGRVAAVVFESPDVKWVKLHGNQLEVIYIKGFVKVTVRASLNNDVVITSVTLDSVLPCGYV